MSNKWIFGLLLLSACGHHVMTMNCFCDVSIGTSCDELQMMAGKPYQVRQLCSGETEYEYIERLKVGSRTLEERHYFFILRDNKVVGKRVEQSSPPPFERNSYDMQTSLTDDLTAESDE